MYHDQTKTKTETLPQWMSSLIWCSRVKQYRILDDQLVPNHTTCVPAFIKYTVIISEALMWIKLVKSLADFLPHVRLLCWLTGDLLQTVCVVLLFSVYHRYKQLVVFSEASICVKPVIVAACPSSRTVHSGPNEFRRWTTHQDGDCVNRPVFVFGSVRVCGWLRCQENNVFRLQRVVPHWAAAAPSSPRQHREVMKSNRYYPFMAECLC